MAAISDEHARNNAKAGEPPPTPSTERAPTPLEAAAARSELHRLQRECMSEAVTVENHAAKEPPPSPPSPPNLASSFVPQLRKDLQPPAAAPAPVTLEEFCAALFYASLGIEPPPAPALPARPAAPAGAPTGVGYGP